MTFENQSETLDKRILCAKKYWSEFLSDLPLRVANFSSLNQTINTNDVTSPKICVTEKIEVAVSQ